MDLGAHLHHDALRYSVIFYCTDKARASEPKEAVDLLFAPHGLPQESEEERREEGAE